MLRMPIVRTYEGLVRLRTKSIFIAHQIARTPAYEGGVVIMLKEIGPLTPY
jgi:hypothetical protein